MFCVYYNRCVDILSEGQCKATVNGHLGDFKIYKYTVKSVRNLILCTMLVVLLMDTEQQRLMN